MGETHYLYNNKTSWIGGYDHFHLKHLSLYDSFWLLFFFLLFCLRFVSTLCFQWTVYGMYIPEFGFKFIIFCFNHFCSVLLRFPDSSYSPLLTSDISTASLSFILSNLIKQMTYLKFLSTILLVQLSFYSKYPIVTILFPSNFFLISKLFGF